MEIKSSLPVVYRSSLPAEPGYPGETPAGSSGSFHKQRQLTATVPEISREDIVEISEWSSKQRQTHSVGRQESVDDAGRNGIRHSVDNRSSAMERIVVRPESLNDRSNIYSPYNNMGKVQSSQQAQESAKGLIIDTWA